MPVQMTSEWSQDLIRGMDRRAKLPFSGWGRPRNFGGRQRVAFVAPAALPIRDPPFIEDWIDNAHRAWVPWVSAGSAELTRAPCGDARASSADSACPWHPTRVSNPVLNSRRACPPRATRRASPPAKLGTCFVRILKDDDAHPELFLTPCNNRGRSSVKMM